MRYDELNAVLEGIPSDAESVVESDVEDDLEAEFPVPEGDLLEGMIVDESEWESEDEVPLLEKNYGEKEKWTHNRRYRLEVLKDFEEPEGPILPEELQAPVDIFLHLFSDDMYIGQYSFPDKLVCNTKQRRATITISSECNL